MCLGRDTYGNVVAWLRADRVADAVEFRLTALVEHVRDEGPAVLPAEALRWPGLLRPTRLTAADDHLRDLSADLTDSADTPLENAERICDFVHSAISYEYGVTSVRTTAAEALAGGRGVCQDSAHVMLALCHLARLGGGHHGAGAGRSRRCVRPLQRPPDGQWLRHGRDRPRLR